MGYNFGTTYLLIFIFWDISQNYNLYPLAPRMSVSPRVNPTRVSIPLIFTGKTGLPDLARNFSRSFVLYLFTLMANTSKHFALI